MNGISVIRSGWNTILLSEDDLVVVVWNTLRLVCVTP